MEEKVMRMRYARLLIIIAAFAITACTLRFLLLPHWFSHYISSRLETLHGYQLEYEDYSLSVFTTSYSLKNVKLIKLNSQFPVTFFQANKMTTSLDWEAVTKGFWVSKVFVQNPAIILMKATDKDGGQTGLSPGWTAVAKEVALLPVNEIEILNGEIKYYDVSPTPKIILRVTEISVQAKNLFNVQANEKILSGMAEGSAKVMDAVIRFNMELNTFYKTPMFNLNAELTELNLIDVREFLKAYGKPEIRQGIFSLYTHASTRNNKIVGYVKPLIEDVTIASHKEEDGAHQTKPLFQTGKSPQWAVKNASRANINEIEFEGALDKGPYNVWAAVGTTLHNAFVESLVTLVEQSTYAPPSTGPAPINKPKAKASKVSLRQSVSNKKGFLKRIFKGKETRK